MNKRPSPLNLVRGALNADVYYQSGRKPKESRTNIEKLPGAEARTLMMRTLGEMMMFITRLLLDYAIADIRTRRVGAVDFAVFAYPT